MSPTIPPDFEHLPAEIHGQILRQMSSPEEVYSTIRASPQALGSFLCFREGILIQVLQAHLPPEIFAEYLGLLHIPKYEDFKHVPNRSQLAAQKSLSAPWDWEFCKHEAWTALVDRFLEVHFQNVDAARLKDLEIYSKPNASEKAQVSYLISTYGMLKRFMRNYQLFVRKNMANTWAHLDCKPPIQEDQLSQDWSPLSQNETIRLHRGFLRYELCCRLNIIPNRDGATLQSGRYGSGPAIRPLSTHLDHWEEGEVRCIQAYVRRIYQGVARDVVEDFCCDVWRLSRKARDTPGSRTTLAPEFSPADGRYSTGGWDDGNDGFLGWEYNMADLGLPILQQVLQSGADVQRRFLKNTNSKLLPPYWEFPFLRHNCYYRDDGLKSHPRANPIYNTIALELSTAHARYYRRSSKVWLYDGFTAKVYMGLRETGWVFWDDPKRVEYFAVSGRHGEPEGDHITDYIDTMKERLDVAADGVGRVGLGARYPEDMMYVTIEGHDELMDKYAAKPVEPDAENFMLARLRALSDWSSREVSPAFQEICSRTNATE